MKAFDYKNPIHQQIGVKLALIYYCSGDFNEVFEDGELMNKICKEFWQQSRDESQNMETDEEIILTFIRKNQHRFVDPDFLQINYTSKAQTEDGDDYWDVQGGQYGKSDIDPSGGYGLHSHQ